MGVFLFDIARNWDGILRTGRRPSQQRWVRMAIILLEKGAINAANAEMLSRRASKWSGTSTFNGFAVIKHLQKLNEPSVWNSKSSSTVISGIIIAIICCHNVRTFVSMSRISTIAAAAYRNAVSSSAAASLESVSPAVVEARGGLVADVTCWIYYQKKSLNWRRKFYLVMLTFR